VYLLMLFLHSIQFFATDRTKTVLSSTKNLHSIEKLLFTQTESKARYNA